MSLMNKGQMKDEYLVGPLPQPLRYHKATRIIGIACLVIYLFFMMVCIGVPVSFLNENKKSQTPLLPSDLQLVMNAMVLVCIINAGAAVLLLEGRRSQKPTYYLPFLILNGLGIAYDVGHMVVSMPEICEHGDWICGAVYIILIGVVIKLYSMVYYNYKDLKKMLKESAPSIEA